MTNKHRKRCSIMLIIIEMQILMIAVRYYLTQVRMAIIKKLQTIGTGGDVEER